MRDLPVDLGGYTLIVSESPCVKTREEDGQTVEVVDLSLIHISEPTRPY